VRDKIGASFPFPSKMIKGGSLKVFLILSCKTKILKLKTPG